MSMAIDNLALKKITLDLEEELVGAFFDKPFALSTNQFALPYHSGKNVENKGRGSLIFSLDGTNPFVCYSFDKYTKIEVNTPFFNSLKKLTGSKVTSVTKYQGERIVTFHMETKGGIEEFNLAFDFILELFPQKANAYIVAYPYAKVVSLYKEHGDVFSTRYITRNLPYLPPLPRREVDESFLSLEEIKPYLSRSTFRLLSSRTEEIGFTNALKEMLDSKNNYIINNSIEPSSFNKEAKLIETKNIYSFFVADQKSIARKANKADLENELTRILKVTKKKKDNLIKDLEGAKNHLIYKDYGQLLYLQQLNYVPKSTFMDIGNFHIILDPKLDVIENANKYFKKYHKAKLAIDTLTPLIEKTEYEIHYLETKLLELDKGTPRDVLELKQELSLEGYLKNQFKVHPSKKNKKVKYEPHYLVSDEYKIGFGMNALQNEELTFNIAKKDDIFLHVDKAPGSHVVILGGDSNKTRLLASELALYLSNKNEGDVMIAKKQDVKKNKEAKGLVNVLNYKLITIKKIREESLLFFKDYFNL